MTIRLALALLCWLATPAISGTYPAGSEEVCFVPRVSVMEVQGKKVKSTTFMVAVRYPATRDWKYLDGANLRVGLPSN